MARTSTYPLVDRLLGGTLTEKLTAWDADGDKPEEIAYRLRSEYDVALSSSTVRRWINKAKEAA